MPTEKIKKVAKEIEVKGTKEIKVLSTEDKLNVREAQLKVLAAREQIRSSVENAQKSEKDFIDLLKALAAKLELNPDEYLFNADNLTFQHK